MPARRSRLPVVAFCTSLGAHAAIIATMNAVHAMQKQDEPSDTAVPKMVAREMQLQLGTDEPLPPTPAWLGSTEPQPHLAPQSLVDQAAFAERPVASAVVEPTPSQPPAPPPEDPMQAALASSQSAQQEEVTEANQPTPIELEPSARSEISIPPALDPTPRQTAALADPARELLRQMTESMAKPAPPPAPAQTAAASASASEVVDGTPADKEADPSSTIEVPREQWQYGKPLTGRGLQLKPRRPTFALLTLMTAAPGNPLCEIKFGKDGVPVEASLLRRTGDSRVDDAIVASLYRWRAEGEELKRLADGQTVPVRIKLLLTRRSE